MPSDDVLEAAKKAGYQLVKEGKMSQESLEIIGRELIPRQMFIENLNPNIQQILDALNNRNSSWK